MKDVQINRVIVNGVQQNLYNDVVFLSHRQAVLLAGFRKYKKWYYVSVCRPDNPGFYTQLKKDDLVVVHDGMHVEVYAMDPEKRWWEFWK